MRNKIKTIVIEDENLLREMFVMFISGAAELEVIGDWKDAESALENLDNTSPDIAIVDYHLPGMDGVELTRKLVERCPGIKTLILTAEMQETSLVKRAFDAGATGFLHKAAQIDELLFAIKAVGRGSSYLYTDIVKNVVLLREDHVEEKVLSQEDISILKMIGKGFANKEMADQLKIPQSTLKYKLERILKTLKARDRANALLKALQMGVISLRD
jgi:DNA-binding NarL/FixJ family response regulator